MTSESGQNQYYGNGSDTIWERLLSPVVLFLIDEEKLKRYALSIDWKTEGDLQGQAASRLRIRSAEAKIRNNTTSIKWALVNSNN